VDDSRCGFCRGHSTTEQISTLQQIFEKSWDHAKAQKIVSVSTELNHNRSALVLDSDNGVCCHHSSS